MYSGFDPRDLAGLRSDVAAIRCSMGEVCGLLKAQSMGHAGEGSLVADMVQNCQALQRGILDAKGETEKRYLEDVAESEARVRVAQEKVDGQGKRLELYAELQSQYEKFTEQKPQILAALRAQKVANSDAHGVLSGVYKVSAVSVMLDQGKDVSDVVRDLKGCAEAKKALREVAATKEKLRQMGAPVPESGAECEQASGRAGETMTLLEERLKSLQTRHEQRINRLSKRRDQEHVRHDRELKRSKAEAERLAVQAQEQERYTQMLNGMM